MNRYGRKDHRPLSRRASSISVKCLDAFHLDHQKPQNGCLPFILTIEFVFTEVYLGKKYDVDDADRKPDPLMVR